jgi:hypothetical protein
MSVEYTKKTWYDGSEGGTPITAAELNRIEAGIDDVVTQSNADKANIDNHTASKVNSSDGAHGLRYYDDKFSYYDEINKEWVDAETTPETRLTFLKNHLIPNVDLSLENFREYIDQRKILLRDRIKLLFKREIAVYIPSSEEEDDIEEFEDELVVADT